MKLTWQDLEELLIEMEEIEEIQRQIELSCDHEDAGDRI